MELSEKRSLGCFSRRVLGKPATTASNIDIQKHTQYLGFDSFLRLTHPIPIPEGKEA
jgi:hypothetical protein